MRNILFHIGGNEELLLIASSKTKDKVEGALLLDVVVRKSASVLELLASEDQSLLVRGDSFLVLDLLLHGLDGVGALDLKGDGLASQSLHENLHCIGLFL